MQPKEVPAPPGDPLNEPTVNTRLRAAYRQAGYNRSTWAKALNMSYPGAVKLEGEGDPKLTTLIRAVEVLREKGCQYTLDEIVFGHFPPRLARTEPELSTDAIKALLFELRADQDSIEALGVHADSPAGRYVRYTRSYVGAFVERYRL